MEIVKWLVLILLVLVIMTACAMDLLQQREKAEKDPLKGVKEVVLTDGTKCALYRQTVDCNWKN